MRLVHNVTIVVLHVSVKRLGNAMIRTATQASTNGTLMKVLLEQPSSVSWNVLLDMKPLKLHTSTVSVALDITGSSTGGQLN